MASHRSSETPNFAIGGNFRAFVLLATADRKGYCLNESWFFAWMGLWVVDTVWFGQEPNTLHKYSCCEHERTLQDITRAPCIDNIGGVLSEI